MADEVAPKKLKIFLAHSSQDKPKVRQLYARLQNDGLQPWLDKEDLLPGQRWQQEIPKAVRQSDIVLVCLSVNSVTQAGYVNKEILFALDVAENQPEDSIFLIPLRLEECKVLDRLTHLHWVDYFEEDGYEKLLRALRVQAKKLGITFAPAQPAPKPIEREQDRLLQELTDPQTDHQRRQAIGERLNKIGDYRPGVGVRGEDGTPDIAWLPVAPGGKLIINNLTYTVPPFYISKYMITYAQYAAFVNASDGFNNPEWWQGMPKEYQKQKLNEQRTQLWNNPRDRVSWYQSVAFARWLHHRLRGQELSAPGGASGPTLIVGKNAQVRLPLEWEWQWAAQGGSQQRQYPWGNWEEGRANTSESKLGQTIAVGMYPHGAAICGAEDMSGQLWEWCQNEYSNPQVMIVNNSTNSRVLRGGSFGNLAGYAACAIRANFNPFLDHYSWGFRVVVGSSPIAPSDL